MTDQNPIVLDEGTYHKTTERITLALCWLADAKSELDDTLHTLRLAKQRQNPSMEKVK